jgi:hypothetical protein
VLIDYLPNENDLLAQIAVQAGVSEEAVKDVLAEAGVSLSRPLPAQRSLLAHRMYARGVKAGTTAGADGPFELDIPLAPVPGLSRAITISPGNRRFSGHLPGRCAVSRTRPISVLTRAGGSSTCESTPKSPGYRYRSGSGCTTVPSAKALC